MPDSRVAVLYITAGMGHRIPAQSIAEGFQSLGIEAQAMDFFDIVPSRMLQRMSRGSWRWLLRRPKTERFYRWFSGFLPFVSVLSKITAGRQTTVFFQWVAQFRPDAIVCCNSVPAWVLPRLVKTCVPAIPVLNYNTDVFYCLPENRVPGLTAILSPTTSSVQHIARKLQSKHANTPVLQCPVPVRSNVVNARYKKRQARRVLGIADRFTLLISFGGEGIGTIALMREIARQHLPVQILIVGGMDSRTTTNVSKLQRQYPALSLTTAGMAQDIALYLAASDIVAGKAGANTICESLYMQRPFLITCRYYLTDETARFLEQAGVGWLCTRTTRQADIIRDCLEQPEILQRISRNFQSLPLQFSASSFARLAIAVCQQTPYDAANGDCQKIPYCQ